MYKKFIIGFLVFTLFNISDVFLLLKIKPSGLNDSTVLALYIFYNLVYAIFAFPIVIIADKSGLKKIFGAGLITSSSVYGGMANAKLPVHSLYFFFFTEFMRQLKKAFL